MTPESEIEVPAFPWSDDALDSSLVSLVNVFVHVTKACNLRCGYCYFSAGRPNGDEMTTEDFAHLWPELIAIQPRKIVLTGGEPFVRPDIMTLLADLRRCDPDHSVTTCVNSNGHLVTPEIAKRLVGLADEVRVSLDALPERNDALRGAGNFDAAMRALDCYYDVGFEPKVLITVTTESLPDLEELLCMLVQRRFTRINLNFFRPIGRGKARGHWTVEPEAVNAAARRAWVRTHPDKPIPQSAPEIPSCSNCGVGSYLNIMPNGDVFPCHALTDIEFRCGNVRRQSLVEICDRRGLLGSLQGLDFNLLSSEVPELGSLTTRGTCMGLVYAKTSELPVWRDTLPIVLTRKPDRSTQSPEA